MLAPLSWVRPSEDLRSSSSYCFGALAAIQAFASARNAASCGVSSKFMASSLFLVIPDDAQREAEPDPESSSFWIPGSRSAAHPE